MNKLFFILAIILIVSMSGSAQADIDHLCLKQCMAAGSSGSTCLEQCTYGQEALPASPEAAAVPPHPLSHHVLNAPIPLSSDIILSDPQTKSLPVPTKDYNCFNQCLHVGNAYSLCEKRCAKIDCPPNVILCKDSMGTTGSTSPPPLLPPSQ